MELEAARCSLSCMHGEMNANSWSVFHLRNPSILFSPEAQFHYVDEANTSVGEWPLLLLKLFVISRCLRSATAHHQPGKRPNKRGSLPDREYGECVPCAAGKEQYHEDERIHFIESRLFDR